MNVLEGVVADQERSQLVLIKADKPVYKCAVGPACRLCAQKIWRSSAWCVRYHRFLFVRMHDLFIYARSYRRGRSRDIMISTCFRWNQNLLDSVHKSAKNQSGQHYEHQSCWDNQIVVIFWVALWARLWSLPVPLNFEDKSECNSSANHASIGDEQKLSELDCLLLEAASAHVKGAQHANDSPSKNNGKLHENEWPAPPGGNCRV